MSHLVATRQQAIDDLKATLAEWDKPTPPQPFAPYVHFVSTRRFRELFAQLVKAPK